ncbi:hypothetical protein QA640_15335 [Bradyrhizobium sp. CB82]|uniref:hypothetical protein n=1 Tax=Bradyrhizobium sp. CB82 TaxID=3039159 RepID=UPI0024B20D61|nr:hypothetical protein [Bradyrhizobium sp. CB82]WFU43684.1 hypothetical protein QA640_15335 [Bradyrhizobium sp. CB82]
MSEKTVDERIELQGWTGRIEPRAALLTVMAIGTVLLAGLLFYVMLKQPFEPNDDLIWFTKLRKQSFWELPLSPAWILQSPFYRPVAEIFLKSLYLLFGMELAPYRWVQFAAFLLLMWLGFVVVRQLRLPWESSLLLVTFTLGSPFLPGSLIWISELPHVIILICFAAALTTILSEQSINTKLVLCALAFAVAVLSKENGLALAIFYLYFLRTAPIRAALVFGGITAGYLLLRALVLGPSIGAGGVNESVGYFFDYLTHEQRMSLFPGHAVYRLYVYNVTAQLAALLFRATQWGIIISHVTYHMLLHTASTVLIAIGLAMRIKRRDVPVWLVILVLTILGGTLFSYSYARDRHLALPAFAYGILLVVSCCELGQSMRSRLATTSIIFWLWLTWSYEAYRSAILLPGSSLEVVEKSYRPYPEVQNPRVDSDIWTAARRQALDLAPR